MMVCALAINDRLIFPDSPAGSVIVCRKLTIEVDHTDSFLNRTRSYLKQLKHVEGLKQYASEDT